MRSCVFNAIPKSTIYQAQTGSESAIFVKHRLIAVNAFVDDPADFRRQMHDTRRPPTAGDCYLYPRPHLIPNDFGFSN